MKWPIYLSLILAVLAPARADAQDQLRRVETKYYVIHTDLPPEDVLEAEVRMTRMAEEYQNRTRDFSGKIRGKLPFYLFRQAGDYYEAGGVPGSAGLFTGDRLMAIAGSKTGAGTWYTIQHEGFHQFAHSVIGGELPVWVNEGLAEYFGEAIFTGDSFVSGVIPHFRLVRLRQMIKEGKNRSVEEMMKLSHEQWNDALSIVNYDQAWSMVHFLAHAENGKYQSAFAQFIKLMGKNRPWKDAWKQTFGDTAGFEEKWKQYWTSLPDNPTLTLYGQATVLAMTSFLARASAQGQAFANFDQFSRAGKEHELKMLPDDPLPPKFFDEMNELAVKLGEWRLEKARRGRAPALTLQLFTGPRITGYFTLKPNGHLDKVTTEVAGEKSAAPRSRPGF